MIFKETKLKGAFIIDIEPLKDERGSFARSFCQKEFENYGLHSYFVQCNISCNTKKSTFRGMHYQISPKAEAKLVRCTKGTIYDVIVDIRPESLTYCQWEAIELSEETQKMIYIPEGFAHGFITMEPNTEVFYQMSEFYDAESARGVRWDDPAFEIEWPISDTIISRKDMDYPNFKR